MNTRIAILGAGRLGESMLRGFLSSGWRQPADISVTARREEHLAELREKYEGVAVEASNTAALRGAGLVIVSVKPQDMEAVLEEIGKELQPEQTVLSTAAGVTTASIEAHLPTGTRVVRAMPNAPALVHEGIAGICPGHHASETDLALAADFALLAEAMIEAGLLLGLSREISTQLVVQTMFGSALLLRDEKLHPVELRENVTSPGGTTTRAIRELERSGVRAAFLNAINAATERSRELSERVSS
jgi:pyrroline-5-carboxylate reductase